MEFFSPPWFSEPPQFPILQMLNKVTLLDDPLSILILETKCTKMHELLAPGGLTVRATF
jgi:hypothetical protein